MSAPRREPTVIQPGRPATGTAPRPSQDRLVVSRRLARVMDDLVTVPGTRVGLGLDALIGLVPGIGDLLGSTLSGVVVFDAVRHRVPIPVLARMGLNLLLDAVLGLVPTIGDLLDVAHRANRKNLQLLERSLAEHPDPRPPSVGYVLAAVGLVILPLLLGIAVGVVALWLLVRWLFG
jgi:Domain of unknown function (DUF4112)